MRRKSSFRIFGLFRLISLIYFCFPGISYAQSQFETAIGGTGQDIGYSIVQTTSGGYTIAGTTFSFGTSSSNDVYIISLNSVGVLQWTRTVGGTGNDYARSIVQTTDGGYAVAGYTGSFGAGFNDVYVVKLDAAGAVQWTRAIGGTGSEQGNSIVQTSDGGYAIAGYTNSFGAGGTDLYVVKLDATGALQWTRTVGSSGSESGMSIVQTSNGGYAIAGDSWFFGAGSADVYVVRLDASGTLLWTRTVGGTGSDYGQSIAQNSAGEFAIGGYTNSFGGGSNNVYVVKLDAAGTLQWTRTVGGASSHFGFSIVHTSDGGYATVGGPNTDAYIAKLDSAGVLQWTRSVGGAGNDEGWCIIQTSDGGYAFTGLTTSFGLGSNDVYIVKLNSSGNSCRPTGTWGTSGSGGTSSSGGTAGSGGVSSSGGTVGSGGTQTNICFSCITISTINPAVCDSFTVPSGNKTYTASGTYSDTIPNAGGCDSIITINLTVGSSLPVSISGTTIICNGDSTVLTASGGTDYNWSTGESTAIITIYPTSNTTYSVIVTSGTCSDTASVMVMVNQSPNPAISGTTSICNGSTAVLTASGGGSYSWNTGATTASLIEQPTITSTYTVVVTDNGCSKYALYTVTVHPIPSIILSGITTICEGETASITASGSSSGGYSWSTGDTNNSISVVPSATTTYSLTLTDSGCSKDTTVTVSVFSIPDADAGIDDTICVGEIISLSASGGTNYLWSTGATTANDNQQPTTNALYTVTVSNGPCSDIDSVEITVIPSPSASAGADITIISGNSTVLSSTGGGTYQWSPSSGLSCVTCISPVANPTTTSTYYLTVTHANGCTSMDSVTITVEIICGTIYVPTAFSPNDDGQNDVYQIKGNCIIEMQLIIYDRWGEKVFETNDINKTWDGKFGSALLTTSSGKLMDTAVFAYQLTATLITGETFTKKGNISLIR